MGAWGGGLFQSDQDLDIAGEISDEAGMNLEMVDDEEMGGKGLEATRKALNDGVLKRLFEKYRQAKPSYGFWESSNKYYLVILGALAMQIGAQIEADRMDLLRSVYKGAGLMDEGLVQFQHALKSYQAGTPWNFNSPGLIETMNARATQRQENNPPARFDIPHLSTSIGD